MTADPSKIRTRREDMLLRLLVRMVRVMNESTISRTVARGHHELQPSYTFLLGNLDAEQGTRIGALARRMGVTRQAASQLLQEIEQRGLVTRQPDPLDKRGVIAMFTPKGRKTLAAAMDVMTELEAEYAKVLGQTRMRTLKQLLKTLVDDVDPSGKLGMD